MIKVARITNRMGEYPSQWWGETDDGKALYIRYRSGDLRVDVDDVPVFEMSTGDELGGSMSNEEMATLLADVLDFSEAEIGR